MVKQSDVLKGINKMIADAYQTHPVYVHKCPKDFARPSFLLEFIRRSPIDKCKLSVEKTFYFTITCFTELDKHSNADPEELADIQEDVIQLFTQGYVLAGDRAIEVKASTGGMDDDRAYIDLQFEFFDNRTEKEDTTPLITSVNTRIQEV